MNDQLDHGIRTMLDEIVARAPTATTQPTGRTSTPPPNPRRPALAVAATLVVLAGLGGLYAAQSRQTDTSPPTRPAAATQPTTLNPSGRPNGVISDPHAVDFTPWLTGAPNWPNGQPTSYLTFDVSLLDGWTQLDQTGGHQIGDGSSYNWQSNINDPEGRQFHLTISDSDLYPRVVNGEAVDINGTSGLASEGEVSWNLDATHIATTTEFGTSETDRVIDLAKQLRTTTIPTLPGWHADPTVSADVDAEFTGAVNGVTWSASATPDAIRFVVSGASSETYGGDSDYRLANNSTRVTAVGSSICVLITGYIADAQTTVELILSDGTSITIPTRPLDDGEYWFGACLPYELDTVAVDITPPEDPQPDRYLFNEPFLRPTVGSFELLPQEAP